MLEEFRRTVTGFDESGKSVFVSQEALPELTTDIFHETYWKVWGTQDGLPQIGSNDPVVLAPHFPGPGGTRLTLMRFPPRAAYETPQQPPTAAQLADAERKFPGLLGAHDEGSRHHASESVDYAFVIEGELTLELDDGAVEVLKAGSFVVQRGTRHSWRNDSEQPVLVLFVVMGAERSA